MSTGEQRPIPFKMIQQTDWEKWRAATLWDKEPETIAWIDSFAGDDGCLFIDVGACIGCYSLYAAHKWPTATVIAIEPHPENFHRLDLNCAANGFHNVVPVCAAIGRSSSVGLFSSGNLVAGSSGGQVGEAQEKIYSFGRPVFALDDLYQRLVRKYPTSIYVKIDIDGLEGDVLAGMHSLLRHPALKGLLVEFNADAECKFWSQEICNRGFSPDNQFMRMENHSNGRRARAGDMSRNVIFIRR